MKLFKTFNFLFVSFILLFTGCNTVIDSGEINPIVVDEDKDLSNKSDIVSNLTESEITRLEKINNKFNFLENAQRTANKNDDLIIDEMIFALHEEFGDEAIKYYSEEVVLKEVEPLEDDCRNISVGLSGEGSKIYNAYLIKEWTKKSGPWWCYVKLTIYVDVCNKYTGKSEGRLLLDRADCTYSDSETDKFTESWNWASLRNISTDNMSQIEKLQYIVEKQTDYNIIRIEGDTKYGWYPEITDIYYNYHIYSKLLTQNWSGSGYRSRL